MVLTEITKLGLTIAAGTFLDLRFFTWVSSPGGECSVQDPVGRGVVRELDGRPRPSPGGVRRPPAAF